MPPKLPYALVALLAIGAPVLAAAGTELAVPPTQVDDSSTVTTAPVATVGDNDAAPGPSKPPAATPPAPRVEQPGRATPPRAGTAAEGQGKLVCRYERTGGSNIAEEVCWRVGDTTPQPLPAGATRAPPWVWGTLAATTACAGLSFYFGTRANNAHSLAVDYTANSRTHSFSDVQKLESEYNAGRRWAYVTGAGAGVFAVASVLGLIRGTGTLAVMPVVSAGKVGVLLTLPLDGSIGGAR